MAARSCVFLMYHEIEMPGRALCQSEPGYVRYILRLETFREQMEWLKESGRRCLNVSEALNSFAESAGHSQEQTVCITFDDGCETDLIAAAPVLGKLGFHATSYVTAGFLGQPGYMTTVQLSELDASGIEVGCHSMTHAYLSDASEAELQREIIEAKDRIEQILGHNIEHFSCPGGRYDDRTLAMARRAGFKTVANSEFHANSAATGAYELGRIAILRDISLPEFEAICQGHGLWKMHMQHQTRRSVQRLLGNRAYDRLRAVLLGRHNS